VNAYPWPLIKTYIEFLKFYQILRHLFIPIFRKKQVPKVFGIGFSKTGTSSLYKAFGILGYRSIHFLRAGKDPKEGWIEYLKKCKFDAYSDVPMMYPGMFEKLDKSFPNSKFILTIREKESYKKSYTNYIRGSPWDIKDDQDLIKRMERFENYNKRAIEHFKERPDKLLVMNIIDGDGWDKLCNFLNKPIPNKPFPHKNIGRYKK